MTAHTPTPPGYELRRAAPTDRGALVAMYEAFEPKGAALGLPPRSHPERWLEDLKVYPNFVVVSEGRIVGHGVLCAERDSAELALFVHQDHRGRGVGRMLLEALIGEARRQGLRSVWGMMESTNSSMFALARSMGFRSSGLSNVFTLEPEKVEETLVSAA